MKKEQFKKAESIQFSINQKEGELDNLESAYKATKSKDTYEVNVVYQQMDYMNKMADNTIKVNVLSQAVQQSLRLRIKNAKATLKDLELEFSKI